MKNIKFVAVFSVCGFILSFLFGLFSHAHFLPMILKALIFGIIFGGLGFGISFLADRFLLDDNGGSEIDVEVSTGGKTSDGGAARGQVVDITIRDEELPSSGSDNHYVVGDSHQMLNENDYGHLNQQAHTQTTVAPDPNVSFMPVRSLETLTNVSSKESVTPDSIASKGNAAKPAFSNIPSRNDSSDDGIDTLPDISAFAMENVASSDSKDDETGDVDTDSGGEFVTTATRSLSSDAEVPEIKDASLFAKAISSVLSAEDN